MSERRALCDRAAVACRATGSVDSVRGELGTGRRPLLFNMIDDVTKKRPIAAVDASISGALAARKSAKAIVWRSEPSLLISDQGAEFTSNAMPTWTQKAGIDWRSIASH